MPESRKKQQAAAKAAAFWVGCYIVWAHCLVAWKWMTPPEPPAAHRNNMSTTTSLGNHSTANPVNETTTAAAHEIDEQLQRAFDDLEVAIADTRESNVVLQEQVAALGRWTHQVEQITIVMTEHDPPPSTETSRLELGNLRQLLQLADLSDGADQHLAQAIQELEQWLVDLPAATAHAAAAEDNPWHAVSSYFANNEFPSRRAVTRRSSMVCANPASTVATEEDGDDHPNRRRGPTQSDLEQAEAVVQETFLAQLDTLGLPVTFAETVECRRQALLNAAASTVDSTSTATASSSSRSPTPHHYNDNDDSVACLHSPRDVLPWLQAGLEAVYKKQDVRQALLQALEADGIDTSRISLNADLNNDNDSQTQPPSSTINLRQVLDQPTLHEWSVVVDRFLDWVSGRNDNLDDLLDQWVYAHVSSETDDDRVVGRKLVSFLLRQAGRVEIPAALIRRQKR